MVETVSVAVSSTLAPRKEGLIKSARDAAAWRKYLTERVQYLETKDDLPAYVLEKAVEAQNKFENGLIQKGYTDEAGGVIREPSVSFGEILKGTLKRILAVILPEKAYAYIFGSEDFETCGSLPCSFDMDDSWDDVTPSFDHTSKVSGVDSLKEVVTGEGGGSMKKDGFSTNEIWVQFKVWVPDPVSWGGSGFFSILMLQDGSSNDTIWINVEDYGTARLSVAGDVLDYIDTELDLVEGVVNTIEMKVKIGSSAGDIDIWLNNTTQGSPSYNGSGTMNTGTDNIDAVLAGLNYAPENGISTTYFDDVIVNNSFIGVGVSNASPYAPISLFAEGQTNPTDITDSTPEFSAIYVDPDAGDLANKFRLQVSTSASFTSTYWDTGTTTMATTTAGNRSSNISYAGSALASSTTYYWRTLFLDDSGAAGPWSTTTATFSLAAGGGGNNAPTSPTSLLTEGMANPSDVTDSTPEFSAVYNDPDSGDLANKYRLQVSTSAGFSPLKWDSGTTTMATTTQGSRSPDISYGGSALATSTTYYWRIAFTDDGNAGGAWSTTTATFVINTVSGNSTSTQAALQYLIENQNENGSWGSATTTFPTTVAVIDALYAYGETGTSYQNGIEWLDFYIADNNDYLAQQLELIARSGGATSTAETLAYALDESTGGFPFDRGYEADVLTTAKVLQALTEADYEDGGASPDYTTMLAAFYLTQTQRFDNGWSVFGGGISSIPVTSEAILALLPYRNQVMTNFGPTPIAIASTTDSALTVLKATQSSNGSWNNSLLNTAIAFYTLKTAKNSISYPYEAVSYLVSQQAGNGSFGSGDIYITAQVLKALVVPEATLGNLVIEDIVPIGTLQNQATTTIRIDITNNGGTTVNSGTLHVVTDTYLFSSYDFAGSGISIEPEETEQVTIQIPAYQSYGFVGDVDFEVFVEGEGDAVYPDARYEETLTFAEEPSDLPGLPLYFMAQKYVIDNQPAVNVRWAQKSDPNRLNYYILWKPTASSTYNAEPIDNSWNGAFLSGGFGEDQTYDITVAALALDGSRYVYYVTPVQVKTSSNEEEYADGSVSGSMKSVTGPVQNISLLASGSGAVVDEEGDFSLTDVPYGRGWIRALNFRYEDYATFYTTADTAVTNHKAYTNLIPDTEDPTVTFLAISGESDYVMENLELKHIQLGVDDDIGITGTGIVESATFSYYDPNDSQWHLIGTMPGPLSNTVLYDWYIPDSLVPDTGYKIKATVRDYAGKESAAVEWGPFEITQGNASPTFTFVTPGPTSSTDADLSYTLQWTDSDPEENATILFSYDPDNNPDNANHTNIVSLYEDDPLNQYVWDTSSIAATSTIYIQALISDGYNSNQVIYADKTISITHDAPTAPSTPLTEGQTNPTNITDSTPEFSAIYNDPNNGDVATHYRIQVSATSTFSTMQWDTSQAALASSTSKGSRIADISYAGSPLASSTPYYWRIKFWDTAGHEGAWSTTTASFSLESPVNNAPIAPTSLQTEGQTNPSDISDSTPEFSAIYNDSDAGDSANKYRIQLSTSSAFTSVFWDSGTTTMTSTGQGNRSPEISYTGSALASSTTYYWRIVFTDIGGTGGLWSTSTASFSLSATANASPSAPSVLLSEGQTNPTGISDSTPEFSALFNDPNGSDSANKYRIQVSTSPSFTSSYWDSGTTTMATTTVGSRSSDITYGGSALASSTTYYWRMAFTDIGGLGGAWSTTTSSFSLASGSVATTTKYTVYADALTSGWTNWSWDSSVNFNISSPVYSGSKSTRVIYNDAWGGMYLHHNGISTATSTHVQFAVRAATAGTYLEIELSDTNDEPLGNIELNDYIPGGSMAANTWYLVTIPLSALGATNTTVTGFVAMNDDTGTVYFDDIKFIAVQ